MPFKHEVNGKQVTFKTFDDLNRGEAVAAQKAAEKVNNPSNPGAVWDYAAFFVPHDEKKTVDINSLPLREIRALVKRIETVSETTPGESTPSSES